RPRLREAQTVRSAVLDLGRSDGPGRVSRHRDGRSPLMGALLAVDGVVSGYGNVRVLDGVDLTVPEGAVVVLLGPNGAGKTTMLRVIAGLLPTWRGRILFDGGRLDGRRPYDVSRRGVILVPEGRGVFPALSVRDNL